MKCCFVILLVALGASNLQASLASEVNPIQKIIQMLSGMQAKVIADGEAEQKAYEEYFEWCDDSSKEKQFSIKTAKGEAEDLSATIEKAASDQESLSTKIEELSSEIGTNEADVKAATEIRNKERADFEAAEKELGETIDALGRAIKILEKHAALLQTGRVQNMDKIQGLTDVLGLLVTSSGIAIEDKSALMAFMQTSGQDQSNAKSEDQESELEAELGAPAPAAYESKSGGIVSVLEDMLEKAETQLADARKSEMETNHNYEMMKQSLEDQVTADKKEMDEAKKGKAEAEETQATAEGELEITKKAMAEDEATLKDIQMECMTQADEHEQAIKGRAEELKALATAKKIIQKMSAGKMLLQTSGEGEDTLSFLATKASATAKFQERRREAVKLVKKLSQKFRSMALAQLAQQLSEVESAGAAMGADPFEKVKNMIADMIEKLLKEAAEEAGQKAFCDKEMSETKKSKASLEAKVEDLTTRIDEAEAKMAKLKEEVADLQAQLAEMAKLKATMDKDRADQHEAYLAAKADLEMGLKGVQMALKVLRDYYAQKEEDSLLQRNDEGAAFSAFMQQPKAPGGHKKSSGAASGVIGMLEVAESDFSKNLAETNAAEETAQEEYEKVSQDMEVTKATKEQDVKYKTKEGKSLEKYVSETSEDRSGMQTELDAVLEYYEKLKPQCISKPEPYEERKKRREAEIEGLKEALSILDGEAVFLQTGSATHRLRGISSHSA